MTSSRNPLSGARRFGSRVGTAVIGLLLMLPASTALAQGFGPDPFRPYNSRYDPFVYPDCSRPSGLRE